MLLYKNVSHSIQYETPPSTINNKLSSSSRVMLFNLSIRGHYPIYIRHLVKYWLEQELPGQLYVVVSPKFMQEHIDLFNPYLSCTQHIKFVSITLEEEANLKSRRNSVNRTLRAFQEWHIFCKYAKLLQATQGLVMYFDTCQLPIAFSGKKPQCPFSGIYFRPTFHYEEFSSNRLSWKGKLQKYREKFLLSQIFNNAGFEKLFCLDPFAVAYLKNNCNKSKIEYLSDPVEVIQQEKDQCDELKKKLKIESHRKIFILFGALNARKGIYQLLEAIIKLPPQIQKETCLLLVGESAIEAELRSQVAAICDAYPIQIIEHYEFISDEDVQSYFQLSDVVLAPYQRHVGMSGILLLAAAAQKPVLSSNYGLMGKVVQEYSLGLTVDSTQPEDIAEGLTKFFLESPERLCDRQQMKFFTEQNSAEKFASTIFQNI